MRLLLADDHALVRSGLRRIIADAFPLAVIEEVSSCSELLEKVRASSWSLLLLDIAMGEDNSLEVVPEIKALRPEMPICVLSMYSERQVVVRALRVGVNAYITKDRAPEELLKAMRSALDGKRYLGEAVAAQVAEHFANMGGEDSQPHEGLSSREFEVLLLLASAHSVSEIGEKLHLSVKTISTYRARILEKMGMNSNAQLMRYALQHDLLH